MIILSEKISSFLDSAVHSIIVIFCYTDENLFVILVREIFILSLKDLHRKLEIYFYQIVRNIYDRKWNQHFINKGHL